MHEAGVNGAQYTDVSRCEEMHGWIVHQPCHLRNIRNMEGEERRCHGRPKNGGKTVPAALRSWRLICS